MHKRHYPITRSLLLCAEEHAPPVSVRTLSVSMSLNLLGGKKIHTDTVSTSEGHMAAMSADCTV